MNTSEVRDYNNEDRLRAKIRQVVRLNNSLEERLRGKDIVIRQLRKEVSHEVYMKLCERNEQMREEILAQRDIIEQYQKWFRDHEYIMSKRKKKMTYKRPKFFKGP